MTITLDTEFAVPVYSPVCTFSRHLRTGGPQPTCNAFPEGIPMQIWRGDNQHRTPYPGDHSMRFEPAIPAEGER